MMKLTAILLLSLTACAERGRHTDIVANETGGGGGGGDREPFNGPNDCDVGAGYELDTYAPHTGTLRIVGVYEARNGDAPWWALPTCDACLADPACSEDLAAFDAACPRDPIAHPGAVHVSGTTTTLVLASYEPTNWVVTADEGSPLARVILSGYSASTAEVPAGVTVETADLGYAYQWISTEESSVPCTEAYDEVYCEGYGTEHYENELADAIAAQTQLVEQAEALTGEKLDAFYGCYSMSTIDFSQL